MSYRHPDFDALGLAAGFLCTTNFPTYVKVRGRWRMLGRPRMDSHVVWDPPSDRLEVREMRLVRAGDLVAVGEAEDGSEGVFVGTDGFAGEPDET